MPVWVVSWIFPGITADVIIGGVQAFLIVGMPIFVFKMMWDSNLIESPFKFFDDSRNILFTVIGVVFLSVVFGLEVYNIIAKAQFELDMLVDCGNPPGFCNQAVIDHERDILEDRLEKAPRFALLVTAGNFLVALFTSYLYRKKEA